MCLCRHLNLFQRWNATPICFAQFFGQIDLPQATFTPRIRYGNAKGFATLSAEEKEIVRKCMKTKYKGHIVGDPNIDELLEELERDHGIRLKRLPVTSVIAV